MQIKTVWIRAEFPEEFDKAVNDLLSSGWKLKKREIYQSRIAERESMLYAELEKPDKEDLKEDLLPGPTEEGGYRITLEPDTAYLLQVKRGTSTMEDFANYVIPLGLVMAEKYQSKIDTAISELWQAEGLDPEEETHEDI